MSDNKVMGDNKETPTLTVSGEWFKISKWVWAIYRVGDIGKRDTETIIRDQKTYSYPYTHRSVTDGLCVPVC